MNTKKNKGYGALNLISVIVVTIALAFTALSLAGCPTEEHVHDWGEWTVTTAPTCMAEGVETRTCKSDGTTETRTLAIDPNAHDWDEWKDITKAATCIETGLGKRICKLNSEHTETVIPVDLVNGHDWDDWAEESEPTETVNGAEARSCKRDSTHKDHRPLWATGSAGLDFSGDFIVGTADYVYIVLKGTFSGTTLHIPAYWRGVDSTNYDDYSPVTKIFSFEGTDITAVTFAAESQIEEIGQSTFFGCTSLASVTLPAGLTTIGGDAFSDCASLASITLPASLTTIGENAFANCTSLASITLPDSVTSIGSHAFFGCTSLTSVTIGKGVTEIGDSAFYGCTSLTSITVDAGNQHCRIQNDILYTTTAIVFVIKEPSGSITIPEGITTIDSSVFSNSRDLTGISIPASVTNIENLMVLTNCTKLASITVNANNQHYSSESNILYNKAKTAILFVPLAISGSITIPNGITTIGENAFYASRITDISIPASVTEIGKDAFFSCYGLVSITVDANNQHYTVQNNILYNEAKTELLIATSGISGDVTLPASLTNIRTTAFAIRQNITSITIPASVTSVGSRAFAMWTVEQTINVAGYADQAAADTAWGNGWRNTCNATVKYAGES